MQVDWFAAGCKNRFHRCGQLRIDIRHVSTKFIEFLLKSQTRSNFNRSTQLVYEIERITRAVSRSEHLLLLRAHALYAHIIRSTYYIEENVIALEFDHRVHIHSDGMMERYDGDVGANSPHHQHTIDIRPGMPASKRSVVNASIDEEQSGRTGASHNDELHLL